MAEVLNVVKRKDHGKRNSRRLRRAGSIPAILYGHGEANVALVVPAEEMAAAVRHGSRVVELKGAVAEKALIRDLQWDTYGIEVLHADFTRVSEHERVEVKVRVELRGRAPGISEGGVVEHLIHEVEIECEALSIPERLELSINALALNGELRAEDLHLPEGMKMLTEADTVIVHCVEPAKEDEEGGAEPGTAEPEVIGRKPDEEAEEE